MKHKGLIISTVIFFLVNNTNYFWQARIGSLSFPVFLLLIAGYVALAVVLIGQIYFGLKERFDDRQRIFAIALLATVLTLTILKPAGIINFEALQGKDLFIAEREGAANCMTTFKLKENNKFVERSVCFGLAEVNGDYKLKGDTVFFSNVELSGYEKEYYEFALIRKSDVNDKNKQSYVIRYMNQADTIGQKLEIVKDDLNKRPGDCILN